MLVSLDRIMFYKAVMRIVQLSPLKLELKNRNMCSLECNYMFFEYLRYDLSKECMLSL